MALEKVDLPVPLGPMMAWTSPCLIVRERPLTMGLSPMATWRSLISMADMVEKMGLGVGFGGGVPPEGQFDAVGRVAGREEFA